MACLVNDINIDLTDGVKAKVVPVLQRYAMQTRRRLEGWPSVPKFAGSNPAEAVGFFRAKKSSARLPSEGK
jgi:hypothetical protein